jgi:serine/threonine protein kinase
MEYIPFKSLAELIQTNANWLSLHTKVNIMYSTCQALRYLRDFDIVHLDLKPNNIMLYYNFYVKLIDFG